MDLFLLELVLWAGLLFLFWSLKDGLSRVESDMEALGLFNSPLPAHDFPRPYQYACPEKMTEPIGSYKDKPIYQYAMIDGRLYQFAHILLGNRVVLRENERCIEPGLIYVQCEARYPDA